MSKPGRPKKIGRRKKGNPFNISSKDLSLAVQDFLEKGGKITQLEAIKMKEQSFNVKR